MFASRMKEVDVGGAGTALLVRDGQDFYAIGPKCSHYGAPLVKGLQSSETANIILILFKTAEQV